MKKKISKLLVMLCVAGIAVSNPKAAHAAQDTFTISQYSESFVPAEDNNATLNIAMTVTTGKDGLVYVPQSVANSELMSATVNGQEVIGEATTIGSVPYFVLDTLVPEAEVSVEAQVNCADFYAPADSDPDTGIPTPKMSYKFINKGSSKIESYTLSIALPEGLEPMSVTTPSDVTKYTLGMNEEGQRTLSLKGSIDVAANSGFEFTFGTPFIHSTMSKVVLWVVVLGASAYVLINRLREVN